MSHSKRLSKNANSVIVFLPIKPIYAKKLIAGEKKYEFRKRGFRLDLTHIIIYASSPLRRIVGVAEVQRVIVDSPTATWERAKQAAGISRKAYREYFQGKSKAYAIKISKIIPFSNWIDPVSLENGFKVPQSFSYVDHLFFHRALSVGKATHAW